MKDWIDGRSILDYIIEQAERYDSQNLSIEHDVNHRILGIFDNMAKQIINITSIYGGFNTVLGYEIFIKKIESVSNMATNSMYTLLVPSVVEYTSRGYNNLSDLIDLGMELQDKVDNFKIKELKNIAIDNKAIDFMRKHAFEYVTDISNKMMMDLRAKLAGVVASKGFDVNNTAKVGQDTLSSTRSRAKMIAQTELSMAYNSGALERLREYNEISSTKMRKYWHGFKFSESTCTYCRPRIGTDYAIDDNSEVLPAHPRCRCIWLPILEGWDKPVSATFTRNARMLNRVYSIDQIYSRINKRLGINYANYLTKADADRYLAGDRSDSMMGAIGKARDKAIKDTIESFDIQKADIASKMGKEFNIQMKFWEEYISTNITDNNSDNLRKSREAIKGVMILPWIAPQLKKWSLLLDIIKDNL